MADVNHRKAGLCVVLAFASCARPRPAAVKEPATPAAPAETVTIVEFSAAGESLGERAVAKFVLPDEEWQRRMTPLGYAVTRRKETELAFTGKFDKHFAAGIYRCAACGAALFRSEAKFDSGTGWPSFTEPIAAANVYTAADASFGTMREEVLCRRCDAHLGHVFPDGPAPTGQRYCMNSAALAFEQRR